MPRTRSTTDAEIRDLLRGAKLRCTPARAALLARLARAGRPLAQNELARDRLLKETDRVTLYRSLAALKSAHLVRRVQDAGGTWRFCAHPRQPAGGPYNHPHFQCTRCGAMECLIGQMLPWIEAPARSLVTGKQLLVQGLCAACAPGAKRGRRAGRSRPRAARPRAPAGS